MGAHRRSDLVGIGVLAPDLEFDLYLFNEVRSLLWSWESGACQVEIVLGGGVEILKVCASDVRHFGLPAFSGGRFLAELEVVDLRASGLEGISYEFISQFDRAFRLLCGGLSVSREPS